MKTKRTYLLAAEPCDMVGKRTGFSTVETVLIIAIILGAILVFGGTLNDGINKLVSPANLALNGHERQVDPDKQSSRPARKPIGIANDQADNDKAQPNLLVGLGIPTAIIGVVAGAAYFLVLS